MPTARNGSERKQALFELPSVDRCMDIQAPRRKYSCSTYVGQLGASGSVGCFRRHRTRGRSLPEIAKKKLLHLCVS